MSKIAIKKEITIEVDSLIYEKALEYGINIEEFIMNNLYNQINEISRRIEKERICAQLIELEKKNYILKLIKIISEESKFDYASGANIIAEAEIIGIRKKEVQRLLDKLIEEGYIYRPIKSNYQIS